MSLSVLERLREATRPAHERLEERLDMLSKLGSVEQRRTLAAAFHRLHAGMERELAPWLADLDGLDFDDRRRSLVLDADLAALGATAPAPTAAPRPAGRAEALGLMYVLEGSSLGGKVIRKHAERAVLHVDGTDRVVADVVGTDQAGGVRRAGRGHHQRQHRDGHGG